MAKVLVVEDNPVNMKLALLLLHKAGHAALCAGDAETGLKLARAALPDLILMDFQLPGMDGISATALLKQDALTAAIPVIALTAMALKTDLENGGVGACDAHIAKPLRYQDLYAAIDSLLAARGSPAVRKANDRARPDRCEPAATELSAALSGATVAETADVAVDASVLEGLIGSDPDDIREFRNAFSISATKIAAELKVACGAGRAIQAGRLAHKLRSSAYTVGALQLGKLCAELEAAGKLESSAALTTLLPAFEQELAAVISCFAAAAIAAKVS